MCGPTLSEFEVPAKNRHFKLPVCFQQFFPLAGGGEMDPRPGRSGGFLQPLEAVHDVTQ